MNEPTSEDMVRTAENTLSRQEGALRWDTQQEHHQTAARELSSIEQYLAKLAAELQNPSVQPNKVFSELVPTREGYRHLRREADAYVTTVDQRYAAARNTFEQLASKLDTLRQSGTITESKLVAVEDLLFQVEDKLQLLNNQLFLHLSLIKNHASLKSGMGDMRAPDAFAESPTSSAESQSNRLLPFQRLRTRVDQVWQGIPKVARMAGTAAAVGTVTAVLSSPVQGARAESRPEPDNAVTAPEQKDIASQVEQQLQQLTETTNFMSGAAIEVEGLVNALNLTEGSGTTTESVVNQEVNQQVDTENPTSAEVITLSQFTLNQDLTVRIEQALGQVIPEQGIAISVQEPLDTNQLSQFFPAEQLPDLVAVLNQQNQIVQQIRGFQGNGEVVLVANRSGEGMTVAPLIRITQGFSADGIELPATSLYVNSVTYLADVDRSQFGLETTPVAMTITPERQTELAAHSYNGVPLRTEVGDVVIAEIDQRTNRIVSVALEGVKFTLVGYEAIATGSDVNFRQEPTLADTTSEGQPNVLGQARQFDLVTVSENYQEAVASLPQAPDQNSHGWRVNGDVITYRDPEGQNWALGKNNGQFVWVNQQVVTMQVTPTPLQEPTPQPPIQATLEPTPIVNPGNEGQATPMPTPAPGEPGAATPTPQEVVDLAPLLNFARATLPEGVTSPENVFIAENAIRAQYQNDAPGVYRYEWNNSENRWIDHNPGRSGRNSAEALLAEVGFFETFNPAEWRWDQDLMMYRDLNGNIFMRGMGTELINGSYNQADRRDGLSHVVETFQTPDFEEGVRGTRIIYAISNQKTDLRDFDINPNLSDTNRVGELIAQNFLNRIQNLQGMTVVIAILPRYPSDYFGRYEDGVDSIIFDTLSSGGDSGDHLGNSNVLHVRMAISPTLNQSTENLFEEPHFDAFLLALSELAIRKGLTGRENTSHLSESLASFFSGELGQVIGNDMWGPNRLIIPTN